MSGLGSATCHYVILSDPTVARVENNDKTEHVLARSDTAELAGFVILQGSCVSFAEAEPGQMLEGF